MVSSLASNLGGWTHDLHPVLFSVLGVSVRWYGLAYLGGLLVAWLLLRWLGQRSAVLVPPRRAEDFMVAMAFGVILGGRLGYCLFYEPALFITFESAFPWWGVLMINRGGMASHGGIIGVIIACWRVSRGFKADDGTREGAFPARHAMDIAALLVPVGMFFGRLANFVNGELLGRIVTMPGGRAPWWAVRYPQELLTDHAPPLTPEQASALRALIDAHRLPGESDASVIRALIERLQLGAHDLRAAIEPLLAARHPSQLYQAFAEGIVLAAVLWFVWRRPRLPGVVGCWFMITYGLLRVATEFYRLPDDHLAHPRLAGLTRGQWLSLLMVLTGVSVLAIIRRRGGTPLGGWLRPAPTP